MGSAEGRRKCCEFFWNAGYTAGFTGVSMGSRMGDEPPSDSDIGFFARTVSKSFQGLYRAGFIYGVEDRKSGYADYRADKDRGRI